MYLFVYYQNPYQLLKISNKINSASSTSIIDNLINLIGYGKMPDDFDVVTGISPSDANYVHPKVISDHSNGYLNDILNGNSEDDSLSAGKLLNGMLDELRDMEIDSDFYIDLEYSSITAEEFDIDDKSQLNGVILDILIDSTANKYIIDPNTGFHILNNNNLIKKFEAELRDSIVITEGLEGLGQEKTTEEQYLLHEFTSTNFLDSYPT